MTDSTNNKSLDWHRSDYANQYFASEKRHLESGVRQSIGPSVLQLGDSLDYSILDAMELPYLLKASKAHCYGAGVVLDPAFLPFSKGAFSTVILPHMLETHALPHQLLREVHRVLQAEGHLVLTGFNPHSLLGLQRFIRPKAVCPGRYYSVGRVIDWLQLLGFEVIACSMFQYGPLSKHGGVRKASNFLEAVGDRWLPMTGGGYMISAKKRDISRTLVGRLSHQRQHSKLIPSAASKSALNNK